MKVNELLSTYLTIRAHTLEICAPLRTEDYVLQPGPQVSPPKWHLAHTSWFFETFILLPSAPGYAAFDPAYSFLFNSYYETVGPRTLRADRGNLSRPTVEQIRQYRQYVDEAMSHFLQTHPLSDSMASTVLLGLNHEQQHQELLLTDIKYILGHNPLFPPYKEDFFAGREPAERQEHASRSSISIPEGLYSIGHKGKGFCFDNELSRHQVYLDAYALRTHLVSNQEYLGFIVEGGYNRFEFWHAEGWDWVNQQQIKAPLYWHNIDGKWYRYTLEGLKEIDLFQPVCHVSYFEAAAFAAWKSTRLPTEAEWEVASEQLPWGSRWEWTQSAYLPYPGFQTGPGAIGEYNGKFMVNQMVLRGASIATPKGHSRPSYRNFFHPQLRWQFTGIRLIEP